MVTLRTYARMPSKIGEALRAARKAKGLSLRDLQKPTGMSSGQISQIESGGRASPAFNTVVKIARAIGVSLDSLVEFENLGSSMLSSGSELLAELKRLQAESVRASRRLEKLIAMLHAPDDDSQQNEDS